MPGTVPGVVAWVNVGATVARVRLDDGSSVLSRRAVLGGVLDELYRGVAVVVRVAEHQRFGPEAAALRVIPLRELMTGTIATLKRARLSHT